MDVSAWNDSSGGFGIRIREEDRDAFFKKTWVTVRVSFRGGEPETFKLTGSFWKTEQPCTEIRGSKIREWFRELGYVDANNAPKWEYHKPPKFELTPLDNNGSFDLVPLSP